MAGLLYYIPKSRSVTRKAIAKAGLDIVIVNDKFAKVPSKGPDGKGGVILAVHPDNPKGKKAKCGYYKDEQTWFETEKYWVGFDNASPPEPIDLERKEVIDGHEVKLLDGREFTIPIARTYDMGTTLPEALVLGKDGKVVAEIIPRFVEISAKAHRLADEWGYSEEEKPTEDREFETDEARFHLAVECLSINYRIGPVEASLLRLLDTYNVVKIIGALIDSPTIKRIMEAMNEARKKKDDAQTEIGCVTDVGEPD